jgi:epoxyqueuosine reductase QueG
VTQLAAFQPRTFELRGRAKSENGKEKMENGVALFAPELEWLASLTQEEFSQIFRGSAVKRAKWRGLVRNACIALGNSQVARGSQAHARIVALLERLASSDDSLLAEHARWALQRLSVPHHSPHSSN